MPRDDTIHRTPGPSGDRPYWQPLLDLVGEFLIGDFMWMGQIELEGGIVIHAYKHSATRRYLRLHEDGGRAFVATGAVQYREIPPRAAIDDVFLCWEDLVDDPDQRAAIRAAIETARERAETTVATHD
jgi:hypothetical protein